MKVVMMVQYMMKLMLVGLEGVYVIFHTEQKKEAHIVCWMKEIFDHSPFISIVCRIADWKIVWVITLNQAQIT